MDTSENTFIPHDDRVKPRVGVQSTLVILCIGIFTLSIFAAGAAYLLRKNEEAKTLRYEEALNRSKERFSTGLPIRTLQEFDTRLRSVRDLLSRHKSFTGLFTLIERVTLKNVQFVSFSYTQVDGGAKNLVKLIGRAQDYKSIVEQSEQFSQDEEARRYITDVVFSNLSVDSKNGNMITFEIMFQVDPEFLTYNRYLTLPVALLGGTDTRSSPRDAVPNIQNQ